MSEALARGGALTVIPQDDGDVPSESHPHVTLTSLEKAAIIMAALGADKAGEFLKGLSEASLRGFAKAISAMRRVPPQVLDSVIDDFYEALGEGEDVRGGAGEARKMLDKVLDSGSVSRIMSDIERSSNKNTWERLAETSESALARFVEKEHPQTAAVILTELRTDKAAAVLEKMDRDFAQMTVLRLSRVPSLDPELYQIIKKVIERDFLSALQRQLATRKPAELIGSLMNNVSGDSREQFLQNLEAQKPQLAAEVQRVMFTFEDVAKRVHPRDIAGLVKAVEEETLLMALKLASQNKAPTFDFILSNISKRLSERLYEDIGAMEDVKLKEGEAAQQAFVRAIQTRVKKGELSLIEDEFGDD